MTLLRHPHAGFTLVEAIMVITITGILAGIVAVFIAGPVTGYVDSARRAQLSDSGDNALRRIGRDLRRAAPNSVSVSNSGGGAVVYLEFLDIVGGGRYRYGSTDVGANNLDWTAADSSFEIIDVAIAPADYWAAGRQILVAPTSLTNAYAATRRSSFSGWKATIANGSAAQGVCAAAATTLPQLCVNPSFSLSGVPDRPSGERFFVVSGPVTYVCNKTAKTLTRYWNYAIRTPSASLPVGATSAVLATDVSDCTFTPPDARGIVSLWLTLTRSGEGVTLFSQATVDNTP